MLDYAVSQFQIGLLVFARLFGMLAIAPILGANIVPFRIRLIFALLITVIVAPMVSPFMVELPDQLWQLGLVVVYELLIGLGIGVMASIVFMIFQLAGQFFSLQIGFGLSQFFDPLQETEASLMGQFLSLVGMLIFVTVSLPPTGLTGVELLVTSVVSSYSTFNLIPDLASIEIFKDGAVAFFVEAFSIALRLAFPVIAVVLFVTISLGILARFAPQMNIFILGFPVYIVVGLFILSVSLSGLIELAATFLLTSLESIPFILRGS